MSLRRAQPAAHIGEPSARHRASGRGPGQVDLVRACVALPAGLRDSAQWLTHACRKDTISALIDPLAMRPAGAQIAAGALGDHQDQIDDKASSAPATAEDAR